MYHVQIEVTTRQLGRIHLGRESYPKTKASGLFSCAETVVAALATTLAAVSQAQRAWT